MRIVRRPLEWSPRPFKDIAPGEVFLLHGQACMKIVADESDPEGYVTLDNGELVTGASAVFQEQSVETTDAELVIHDREEK